MTVTMAVFTVGALLAIMKDCYAAGIAMLLGVATLAVQWLCIDPPHVADRDLH